ncbi:hypothetical protein GGI10_002886 [Coemansia sp. RSA 2530]|nr:hypothetical protein GGI10_002886 [Coemansia sp. RSA 2530]
MAEYLKVELAKLGVDDDAIVEYCVGLLEDTSMDAEEKHEAIVGYLEAAEATQDVAPTVLKAIDLVAGDQAKRDLDAHELAQQALKGALAREREELLRDAPDNKPVAGRQLTADERRQRERLLKAYGSVEPEIVETANGESEIVYREQAGEGPVMERNMNAQIVVEKERAMREAGRLAHLKNKEREKELLEKDRLKKEEKKKRTMKNEKRRM